LDASARPKTVTPSQFEFCLNYLANGFNATAAYKAAYPGATLRSARELGHRLLTKVDIKTFLATQLAEGWKALHMDADEALYLVSCDARADIRELFDADGHLLPMQQWPDSIAVSVKAIHLGPFGTKIVLNDKLTARRIILEQTGKLKNPLSRGRTLARILAGDFEEDADE
jgi:phage terminase small subunit